MKIVQITYTGFGGLGSVVFSLIAADHQREHTWSVGFIGDKTLDNSYPAQCEIHNATFAVFQTTRGRPYSAWWSLYQWLSRVQPEVIICHTITSILACRLFALLNRTQLIAVEHTSNQVKTRKEWLASRVCMRLADKVVVLTDEYRDELRKAHGKLYQAAKVRVIPNGIDITQFHPSVKSAPMLGRTIKLGMAARFSFSKRQDMLVKLMSELSESRPDLIFDLRFAGDGEELDRVMELASESPHIACIHFDGLLSEPEIAEWMRGLDFYVHATDGETLSTSILQAMATSLPIVASAVPGVYNLIGRYGEYGVCVPNDIKLFKRAIIALVDSDSDRESMSQRARQRVCEHYSNSLMLKRYIENLR